MFSVVNELPRTHCVDNICAKKRPSKTKVVISSAKSIPFSTTPAASNTMHPWPWVTHYIQALCSAGSGNNEEQVWNLVQISHPLFPFFLLFLPSSSLFFLTSVCHVPAFSLPKSSYRSLGSAMNSQRIRSRGAIHYWAYDWRASDTGRTTSVRRRRLFTKHVARPIAARRS